MLRTAMTRTVRPDWSTIDTVLLDLDGTLLDLAFDTRFWRHIIPSAWARARGVSLEQAREHLTPRFREREGTLAWYCVAHWSRELELDVAALKRAAMHEVRWLEGVPDFLTALRRSGKRLVLLTNAHPQSLAIKDERTGVSGYVDAMFSSHTFAWPKEDARFWENVRRSEPFDPQRTLFVDDSPTVLAAARAAGIRWVIGLRHPDTQGTVRDHGPWPAVNRITDLAGPESGLA
jgi:5'-nucleotidase